MRYDARAPALCLQKCWIGVVPTRWPRGIVEQFQSVPQDCAHQVAEPGSLSGIQAVHRRGAEHRQHMIQRLLNFCRCHVPVSSQPQRGTNRRKCTDSRRQLDDPRSPSNLTH
jgi:hypothetical protein